MSPKPERRDDLPFRGPTSARLLRSALHGMATRLRSNPGSLWPPFLAFLALLLFSNSALFYRPFTEDADYAANSLIVQDAKHLTALLGQYSRFHFHHPGPALFYVFAVGEVFFHRVLHIVPAPFNAQLLTVLILNASLFFVVLRTFRRYCRGRYFLPVAMALTVLFVYCANITMRSSAFASPWPAHVLLLWFLCFLTLAASVAIPFWDDLPLFTLAACFLVHLHISQLLFVGTLYPLTLIIATVKSRPLTDWAAFRRRLTRPAVFSVAIIVVFIAPVCLDIGFHSPSNLDDVKTYLANHGQGRHGLATSVRYCLALLTFENTQPLMLDRGRNLFEAVLQAPQARLFWAVFSVCLLGAVVVTRMTGAPLNPFVKLLLLEAAVTIGLLLVWACSIEDEFYNYLGFFAMALLWIGLLIMAGLIAEADTSQAHGAWVTVVTCAMCLLSFGMAPTFQVSCGGAGDVVKIVDGLSGARPVRLRFDHRYWETAVGVANQLRRAGASFCVGRDWGFMFGSQNVCGSGALQRTVVEFGGTGAQCFAPCRLVFASDSFSVYARPPEEVRLPIRIDASDTFDVKEGFTAWTGPYRWSTRVGIVRFLLAKDFGASGACKIDLKLSVLPARPARIVLNGNRLGDVGGAGKQEVSLTAPWGAFRPGVENEIEFLVPNAGPVGQDRRELGVALDSLDIFDSDRLPASPLPRPLPESAFGLSSTSGCHGQAFPLVPSFPLLWPLRTPAGDTWFVKGLPTGQFAMKAGCQWVRRTGAPFGGYDTRAAIPFDLAPGQEAPVRLEIRAPEVPGAYVLECDVVQELVSWFYTKGSPTGKLSVDVLPSR